jgi:serine/threonine protein kinase
MTAIAPDSTAQTLADGRYELGDVLGRGGLAVTRRAHDRRLGRWVAIKSLTTDPVPGVAAEQRARFVREAQALARFDHPGIVRVYEVFEDAGTAHLVMELLEGRSVAAELVARGGPLLVDEATALASGVGKALAVVHGAGLLHRDVSPSNVVLTPDGRGGRRPVLIDFGLARTVDDAAETLTRMVTPGFAPPEQYGGDPSRIGPVTDVYGLAATLYHACAGRLPASAVDRQHGAVLEPLRRIRPDLPRPFCDGVHDGLELDPAHRPPHVGAFVARLGLAEETTILPPPTATVVAPPPPSAPPAPAPPPPAVPHVPNWRSSSVENDAQPPPIRWEAAVPLVLLAVAAGVVAPLASTFVLAAIALPVVATIGDRVLGRRRIALPWRLARNVGASVVACIPALVLAGGGSFAAWLIDRADEVTTADDVVAAVVGAAAALLATQRVATDRERFAVADAVGWWSTRCRDGVLYAAWAAGLLAMTGALVLRPDLWPLPPP